MSARVGCGRRFSILCVAAMALNKVSLHKWFSQPTFQKRSLPSADMPAAQFCLSADS
jgi:hypothetical protein